MFRFPPITALCLVALWLATPGAVSAQAAAADLHTRALRLTPSLFGVPPGEKTLLLPMPNAPTGEQRFNALPTLIDFGFIDPPKGTEAIWLPGKAVLVLTTNLKGHELAERILEIPFCGAVIPTLQLTIALWEYQDSGREPERPPYTVDALKKIDGGARIVHTQTVQTNSGRAVLGISGYAAPDQFGKDAPGRDQHRGERKAELRGLRGSAFYFEPVANPQLQSVDMQFEYEVRVPTSKPGIEVELRGNASLATTYGKDVIVQIAEPAGETAAAVPGTKRTKYALSIRADVREEPGRFAEEADTQIKARVLEELLWEKDVIEKAGAGKK